jgi:hypothetical protein
LWDELSSRRKLGAFLRKLYVGFTEDMAANHIESLYGSVHNIQFAAHIFYNGDAKTIAEVKQTQVERQVLRNFTMPLAVGKA